MNTLFETRSNNNKSNLMSMNFDLMERYVKQCTYIFKIVNIGTNEMSNKHIF